MGMVLQDYVDLWHGDLDSFGYHSVWIAQKAAELLDPADEVVLIRRFYRRPGDLPPLKTDEQDDLEDVPVYAVKILTLGYRFHKESLMAREQARAAAA